ncbi:MAG TPA: BamA/TamA family outer membrane protein [Bacteroidia bacterium]|nr:BamA/TamA family outer membrane protein [Bacteroidia bacterium]
MKAAYPFTIFFILIFSMIAFFSNAQYGLTIKAYKTNQEKNLAAILGQLKINYAFPDTLTRRKELNNVLTALYGNGYLAASFDSFAVDTTMLTAYLDHGSVYKWLHLSKGNVDEGMISDAGFHEKVYRNKPVNLNKLRKIQDRILSYSENNGYPFAEIRLDSVNATSNGISAALILTKGLLVTIDSIIVKGDARLSEIYLHNYLGIKPKMRYNEQLISTISTHIKELPMVSETRGFNISFHEDKASVYLYLQNKKASQLDGVIGVLPDNSGSGKVNISGDVHIRLHSSFGYGELFDLNWKQPLPKTQDLKVKFNYPFLFSTPFGLDLNFSIYKKDTTYVELQRNIGIQYLLTGGNYLKAFYNNKTSSLIDVKQFASTTVLPPFADITINSYGIGLRAEKLDYRLNPRRGYSVECSAAVGVKNIKKNAKLVFVEYDSIQLKSTQYNGEITGDYYLPVMNRGVLDIGAKGGFLESPDIFQNELYRIGGLKSLRGFDEESILASRYIIGKLEYRYLIEQNSYLFLFVNGMYYERRERNNFIHDVPVGFGAGITFETKLGIFSLNYALGKEFTNPVLFRSAKIHFGLINYF